MEARLVRVEEDRALEAQGRAQALRRVTTLESELAHAEAAREAAGAERAGLERRLSVAEAQKSGLDELARLSMEQCHQASSRRDNLKSTRDETTPEPHHHGPPSLPPSPSPSEQPLCHWDDAHAHALRGCRQAVEEKQRAAEQAKAASIEKAAALSRADAAESRAACAAAETAAAAAAKAEAGKRAQSEAERAMSLEEELRAMRVHRFDWLQERARLNDEVGHLKASAAAAERQSRASLAESGAQLERANAEVAGLRTALYKAEAAQAQLSERAVQHQEEAAKRTREVAAVREAARAAASALTAADARRAAEAAEVAATREGEALAMLREALG